MIEQLNIALFHLINQYAGIYPVFDSIAIFAAEYMPVVVILALIYLWVMKSDSTHDILLYSVYAGITGLIINYLIGLYISIQDLLCYIWELNCSLFLEESIPSCITRH